MIITKEWRGSGVRRGLFKLFILFKLPKSNPFFLFLFLFFLPFFSTNSCCKLLLKVSIIDDKAFSLMAGLYPKKETTFSHKFKLEKWYVHNIFTTFLQQILNGRLLLLGQKSNLSLRFKFEQITTNHLWFVVKILWK